MANKKDSTRKQFCPKGHDTFICGRYESGCCTICAREGYKRRYLESDNKKNYNQQYRDDHKEEMHLYYINNIEESRKYYEEHKDKIKNYSREYKKLHPEVHRLHVLQGQVKRKKRIVAWGQEGILEFYIKCPEGYVVDHIIPLLGRNISGLHILSNLQYLTKHENSVKSNSWDGTLENNGWRIKLLNLVGK